MARPALRLAPPGAALTPGVALLALALAGPSRAGTIKLFAFGAKGEPLDAAGLARRLSRADERQPDLERLPIWAVPVDGKTPPQRLRVLAAKGSEPLGIWDKAGAVRLELVWPVAEDGYNAVSADKDGVGFTDGAEVYLEEEIAATMYRRFKESLRRRISDWDPLYKQGRKSKELAEAARDAMAEAAALKERPARAVAFSKALRATALVWEKVVFEHGTQIALDPRRGTELRFGLTLDDGLFGRIDDLDWLAEAVQRSGADWVRLVFRPNPADFAYGSLRSFNEYDGIVESLAKHKLKVMGSVLDTAQWPATLTPELYADRVKNIVLHFRGKIDSWEVGSELNGDWLGGAASPLSLDAVRRVYDAGVQQVKDIDPQLETVATLYAWEETAPDREHALSGWLAAQVKKGFGRNLDVVGLSVQPEDNPAGMGLERLFDEVSDALPAQRLMISSLGYVEKDELKGYWWLAPEDVDGGRKDLLILDTAASCAMPRSLGGVFWWQTLEQMLPPRRHKATDFYKVWHHALEQLGRRGEKR